MSKAFDKVWHEGVIFKLKSMGISNTLLDLIESFLENRFQRVLLNDQMSEWLPVKAGVTQGSILGSLFFNLKKLIPYPLFADDTSLFSIMHFMTPRKQHMN